MKRKTFADAFVQARRGVAIPTRFLLNEIAAFFELAGYKVSEHENEVHVSIADEPARIISVREEDDKGAIMHYMTEITTDDISWSTNNLTFESYWEAEQYVTRLAMRWPAVKDWRVRAVDQPVNCKLNPDGTREHL